MKVAIMQPYFFPYIGYFQLMNAVDIFIIYDDAQYVKQGFTTRNYIAANSERQSFTLPIGVKSHKERISEKNLNPELYEKWRNKFLKTIYFNYKDALNYDEVKLLLHKILTQPPSNLADFLYRSIDSLHSFLGLSCSLDRSSKIDYDREAPRQEKIIQIAKSRNAETYINMIGGQELYEEDRFKKDGIVLEFLEEKIENYIEEKFGFLSHLSIIDVMMHCPISRIQNMLK